MAAIVLVVFGPLLAIWRLVPGLGTFVADPTSIPAGTSRSELRTALALDSVYAVVYGLVVSVICLLGTRKAARYRGVRRWMAGFAVAGAIADLAENRLAMLMLEGTRPSARVLPYLSAVKKGLFLFPALFAVGVAIAWARDMWRQKDVDVLAAQEAVRWAKEVRGQTEPKRGSEATPSSGEQREPTKRRARLARVRDWLKGPFWDWCKGHRRPPAVPSSHPLELSDKVGICFSGGGIRSAAYNLGALQELQAAGELQRASYLSAVSGGSYIAGAYALTASCSEEDALGSVPPFAPGTVEEQYLRNRTTYLIPNLTGVAVAGWRLLRGLVVNVAFVALVLFLVARPYGWVMHRVLCDGAEVCTLRPVGPEELPWATWFLLGMLALALLLGLFDLMLRPKAPGAVATETWSLRLLGVALLGGALLFGLPWLAAQLVDAMNVGGAAAARATGEVGGTTAAVSGLSTLLTGLLVLVRRTGGKSSVGDAAGSAYSLFKRARAGAQKVGDGVLRLLLIVVGGIVGPAAFAIGFLVAALGAIIHGFGVDELGGWAFALTVFVLVEGVSDANRWSLQPYYKRRLQSAFGVHRTGSGDATRAEEIAFDTPLAFPHLLDAPELIVCAAVNLEDYGLLPPGRPVSTFTFSREKVDAGLLGTVATRHFAALLGPEYVRDFTVTSAQAASGAAFSPQMGKLTNYATRFIFALLNLRLGVWLPNPSKVVRWAAKQDEPTELAELDAVAVEAAKARLRTAEKECDAAEKRAERQRAEIEDRIGALTGEARAAARTALRDQRAGVEAEALAADLRRKRCQRDLESLEHPMVPSAFEGFPSFPRPTRLFRELFGVFRSNSRFVYVTDGGHYECLGLVELIRRGCGSIYCFDASGDRTDVFSTIADAVAIARTELGVRIDVDPTKMAPLPNGEYNQALCVDGSVLYPGSAEPGRIVFAKLGITRDVPPDVLAWHQSNPRFPTDGTGDQLYTGQRFEAYRALGAFTAERAIRTMRGEPSEQPAPAAAPVAAASHNGGTQTPPPTGDGGPTTPAVPAR